MPSGPHGVGYFSRLVSERLGSVFHAIDIDPRWVKKIAARNAAAEVTAYVDHVLEQATHVLQTQNVANLHATPPLLEAIARDDHLVDLVNDKIRYLLLSGAHVDADTLDLLRDIFPNTTITMAFGSTMILSQAITRIDDDGIRFRPAHPVRRLLGGRSRHRRAGALRGTRPGGDEPHQQGHVHPEQPGTRHAPSGCPDPQAMSATRSARCGRSPRSRARQSSKACTDR